MNEFLVNLIARFNPVLAAVLLAVWLLGGTIALGFRGFILALLASSVTVVSVCGSLAILGQVPILLAEIKGLVKQQHS